MSNPEVLREHSMSREPEGQPSKTGDASVAKCEKQDAVFCKAGFKTGAMYVRLGP